MFISVNYKDNYDTTSTTIQWVLTSVQFNLVNSKLFKITRRIRLRMGGPIRITALKLSNHLIAGFVSLSSEIRIKYYLVFFSHKGYSNQKLFRESAHPKGEHFSRFNQPFLDA